MVDAKLFVCSNASGKSDYHFIKTKSSISKWRFNIRITANCNLPKRTFGIEPYGVYFMGPRIDIWVR